MSSREHALRSLVEDAVVGPGGWEPGIERVMAFLEDMDRAMSFMTDWKLGAVLSLEPDQVLDRWGMTVHISERAARDAEFRRAVLRHPRYVTAIALREGLGIKPIDYLWQVSDVRVVEEEPGLHWLTLPACHFGCGTDEILDLPRSIGSCQVCGKPNGETGGCGPTPSSWSRGDNR